MKHTSADSTKEWEGFRAVAHRLDIQKVCRLGLLKVEHTPEGQEKTTPFELGDALRSVFNLKIHEVEAWLGPIKVTTDAGEFQFEGPRFSRDVLEALLDLRKDGVNGFEALWFWYDHDWVTDMPQDSYSFFVVHNDKIVRERVVFSDGRESGFDPSVFKAGDDSPPIWRHHPDWEEARTRFWYRKFYKETKTGQLMVLREDEPELFYYPEARSRSDVGWDLLNQQLTRISSVLWVMVILIAILAVILLWKR
jgi:hypothetical protein